MIYIYELSSHHKYYRFISHVLVQHILTILKGQEELEDTKGVIRNRISKKNREHNGQKKKVQRTNNDLQNIHKIILETKSMEKQHKSICYYIN